jgi:hypothetical protein
VDNRSQLFLVSVLGAVGAGALVKAAERSAALESALVPRTLLAWVQSAPVYEGEVPGVPGAFVSFEKAENGFTGSVGVGEGAYKFEGASLFHLVASVAVAMGIEYQDTPRELRDLDIEKLGKSIDLLAKAHRAATELEKNSPPGKYEDLPEKLKDKGYSADSAFAIAWSQHDKEHKSEKDPSCSHCSELQKGKDGPGPAAAPLAPEPPTPPTPTAPEPSKASATKPPKPPAAKTLKLTRSEAARGCPSCGRTQFSDDRFVGCACFSDLAKNVDVVHTDTTAITIKLDMRAWDAEGVITLLESIGRQ